MRPRPALAVVPLLALAVALSACATSKPKQAIPAQATQPAAASPTPTVTTAAAPKPVVSTLSGRAGLADGPVLAVKIDNTTEAHPQIGLRQADMIYVEEVEGGVTRLLALYSSQLPPSLGPVRSARITDVDLLPQFGRVGLAFSGAQRRMLPVLARAPFYLASHDASGVGFVRTHSRPAPYNVIGFPTRLLARMPKAAKPNPVGFVFGAAPAGGVPTRHVRATWPGARLDLTWSAGRWLVAMDGRPDRAAEGGILGGTTVVIQYVNIRPSVYFDVNHANTPMSQTIGNGIGIVLRDGKAWPATWSRAHTGQPTTWKIAGHPASFAAGQVWVLLVDRRRPVART